MAAPLNTANIGSDGTFTGYCCFYNTVVSDRDEAIAPGAFVESLQDRDRIVVLFGHDADDPIGVITEWRDDDIGLWVSGKVILASKRGKEFYALMVGGAVDGMSVGFEASENTVVDGVTVWTKCSLLEVSLVAFPAMNEVSLDGDNKMLLDEKLELVLDEDSAGKFRRTKDGYLTGFAKVARTGIQEYKGRELGRPDLDVVRVYRPESEVFKDATIKSFAHKPVTYGHPKEPVGSKNWRKYTAGQVGSDVLRDGEYIRVPMCLMDEAIIDRVMTDGIRELSMGYTTELKWETGQTTDGMTYDAIQTDIQANHLAVVATARGGSNLKIGDSVPLNPKEKTNMTHRIVVDEIPVEFADERSSSIVQRALSKATAAAEDYARKLREEEEKSKKVKDELDASLAEAIKTIGTKDGELAVLKKSVEDSAMTPDKLDVLVKDRQSCVDKAKMICGDAFVSDGKTVDAIRKEAVTKKLGDDVTKTMSNDAIDGAFNALTHDAAKAPASSGARQLSDGFRATVQVKDERDVAFAELQKQSANAWKRPNASAQ